MDTKRCSFFTGEGVEGVVAAKRTIIGNRYELDALPLGQGGMGEVYSGYDKKLDRKVAVKLIRFPYGQHDEVLVKRFLHEARIMAKLEHPGTPAIHDADVFEDPRFGPRPYMVMQYVDGITLQHVVDEQEALPVNWAAAIGAQVAAILSAAHDRGIFHRDLKPSNIMITSEGVVKVLDFGLAMFHEPEWTKLTSTGTMLGTPSYMSPEQARGATVGPQSDLYSLGLILHEMLTGRRVFDGTTHFAILERQVRELPPPIRATRAEVPAELERLVLRMLEKRAEDRPAKAQDVHHALLPFARGLSTLIGVVAPEPSAIRMYAEVVGRIEAEGTAANPVVGSDDEESAGRAGYPDAIWTGPEPTDPGIADFSLGDIARARNEARELAEDSRYGQAVEVLDAVMAPASKVLGPLDHRVLDLRLHRAEVLFEGGDYHRAAPEFHRLHDDLARKLAPDDEHVLYCRKQEATCLALMGETGQALTMLTSLLSDEERVHGRDDDRALELRRQIGLLQLGAGDTDRARGTLSALLDDLARLYGQDHFSTRRVRESLLRLSM
ncbi:serine/threonine-protein kinase [Thermopolyspora sp. NPDC052614]|uniref:serine/threonine protein kinase n=1 Tax=Thermopolyspora sp. NPDC052614 TaxID=3155682 RepID=UPI00342BEEB9